MAEAEKNVELKRKAEDEPDEEGDAEEDEWVGPLPNEASTAKKRKGSCPPVRYLCVCLAPLCLLLNDANDANKAPAANCGCFVVFPQCSNMSAFIWRTSPRPRCMSGATCTETSSHRSSVPSE